MIFYHPEPYRSSNRIYPIFIPFSGCATKCTFCAQDIQTGTRQSVASALKKAQTDLKKIILSAAEPMELAFFGGTFTALAEKDFAACLEFATYWRSRGLLATSRCSTRPDMLTPKRLQQMRESGITTVELGIQSFNDEALARTRRNYSGATAIQSCRILLDEGFSLGIQLMPGMPGLSRQNAMEDIHTAIALHPTFVRLYPCLVIRGTELAIQWSKNEFIPWTDEQTYDFLAEACLELWAHHIPLIRIGVAPEDGLTAHILAGLWHPALGNIVRSKALATYIGQQVQHLNPTPNTTLMLYVPQKYQGELWGHKKSLAPQYEGYGILPHQVIWYDKPYFTLDTFS